MKILSVKYEIEPFDTFSQVYILEESNKFFIGIQTSELKQPFFVFKNINVGGFGYLANKKEINDNAVFFESFTECELYLTGLTEKEFLRKFENNKVSDSNYLLSVNP